MPHFSFWSWPLPFLGTVDEALNRIREVEAGFVDDWRKKIDKVVWRGTVWFNGVGNTRLRPELLRVTKGMDWADVRTLQWVKGGLEAGNGTGLDVEEFCRYKYVIYTEVCRSPYPAHS